MIPDIPEFKYNLDNPNNPNNSNLVNHPNPSIYFVYHTSMCMRLKLSEECAWCNEQIR